VTTPRILVVDDEPGMLRAVERILSRRYAMTAVSSAREALEVAPSLQPDLAILDIRMPDLDGFELTARLKALDKNIDVILMTGSMSNPDQKLVRAIRENAFYFIQKPFDSEVLRTLVERCLDLRRLENENRAHTARLQGELDDARVFQLSLLPPLVAKLEGVSLACRYEPCSELGGDFCDYARAAPGRVAVLVADVSGHGVSAAMLTGIVKATFRSCHAEEYEPAWVIDRIRSAIQPFSADRFITVFAGLIDARRHTLDYVSAGHPDALVWGPNRDLSRLESTGPLISPAFPEHLWKKESIPLGPGDQLLVYTDGVSEARGTDTLFGEEGIIEVVRAEPSAGDALLARIFQAMRDFSGEGPQPDDLTMLTAGLEI
jgi:sigma-B regulation protein RsbU (phosphoserine phosphatase)